MKNRKTAVLSLGILAALVLIAFTCWASLHPRILDPVKEITVVVNHTDNYLTSLDLDPEETDAFSFTWRTTARTLTEALAEREEFELIQGPESYELSMADGEFADNWHGWHWRCFYDREPVPNLGTFPIDDGETYYFYIIGED